MSLIFLAFCFWLIYCLNYSSSEHILIFRHILFMHRFESSIFSNSLNFLFYGFFAAPVTVSSVGRLDYVSEGLTLRLVIPSRWLLILITFLLLLWVPYPFFLDHRQYSSFVKLFYLNPICHKSYIFGFNITSNGLSYFFVFSKFLHYLWVLYGSF